MVHLVFMLKKGYFPFSLTLLWAEVLHRLPQLWPIVWIIWLTPRVGKVNRILDVFGCPRGQDGLTLPAKDCSLCPTRKCLLHDKCFIDQACTLRMAGYSGIALICAIMEGPYMNKQTKTLANIRPYYITKLVQRANNLQQPIRLLYCESLYSTDRALSWMIPRSFLVVLCLTFLKHETGKYSRKRFLLT